MGVPHIWAVPHRFMHVRSPQKLKVETMCLADQAPRWNNKREVFVMQCKHAAKLYDAREVWYLNM